MVTTRMSVKKVTAPVSTPPPVVAPLGRLHASDGEPPSSYRARGGAEAQGEDDVTSLRALEVLVSAQERMKGLVEAASALNRLMAEAADKNNMPFPLPSLPPNLSASLVDGLGKVATLARQVQRPDSERRPQVHAAGTGAPFARLEGVIQTRGFITNEDVRTELSLTPSQATMRLKQWVADRVVVQRGQRRGARYVAGPRWPPRT